MVDAATRKPYNGQICIVESKTGARVLQYRAACSDNRGHHYEGFYPPNLKSLHGHSPADGVQNWCPLNASGNRGHFGYFLGFVTTLFFLAGALHLLVRQHLSM